MSRRGRGLAWAFASAVGAALMVIPWKLAVEAGDTNVSVLLLLLTAAIGSTVLGAFRRSSGGASSRRPGALDLGVALGLAVFTLAGNHWSAVAIREVSPALMNVLLRSDLVFVAIFGWLLLGERVERRFWFGLPLVFVGLAMLQGMGTGISPAEFLESGIGLGVAAAACFSGMALLTRRFIDRIDTVAVNTIRLWISVAYWFALNEWPDPRAIPQDQILWAAIAALTGPFLGRLALMESARYIEARLSTLVMLTAPIMSLGLAWLALGDWPSDHELQGGALMLAGIAIPLLPAGRRR